MMEPIYWIAIAAAFLIILAAGKRLFSTGESNEVESDPLYIRALEAVTTGDEFTAMRYLKTSIEQGPSSFEPYLLLGDLLRKNGHVERALKIHRELSVRPGLDSDRRVRVLKSLVKDQLDLALYADATMGCKKILEHDKKDREALEALLTSYEGSQMWDEAIDVAKRYAKLYLADIGSFMAHYLSYVASKEMTNGHRESAKKKLKRALSYDDTCQPAQIYLGDIYFEENDFDAAIEVWSKYLKRNPEGITDLSSRLEKAYFEEGHFSKMTEVYEDLSHDLPSSPDVLIGLSRMYHRRGEIDAALRLANEARQINPQDPAVYQTLIDLYNEKKEYDSLFGILKEYFNEVTVGSGKFECRTCGASKDELFWKCPQCNSWQIDFQEKTQ